jgi:hypothetical protein
MKQTPEHKTRKRHLAAIFDHLSVQDQAYMETLTAQLAEIQKTAPEGQSICGKNPENRLQQSMEQDTQPCPIKP